MTLIFHLFPSDIYDMNTKEEKEREETENVQIPSR